MSSLTSLRQCLRYRYGWLAGLLIVFYGISTSIDYLKLSPVYTYILNMVYEPGLICLDTDRSKYRYVALIIKFNISNFFSRS